MTRNGSSSLFYSYQFSLWVHFMMTIGSPLLHSAKKVRCFCFIIIVLIADYIPRRSDGSAHSQEKKRKLRCKHQTIGWCCRWKEWYCLSGTESDLWTLTDLWSLIRSYAVREWVRIRSSLRPAALLRGESCATPYAKRRHVEIVTEQW